MRLILVQSSKAFLRNRLSLVRFIFWRFVGVSAAKTVVLSVFQQNLSANFSWAAVSPDTFSYWRKVVNIPARARRVERIKAELLVTALMFRPKVSVTGDLKWEAMRRKLAQLYRERFHDVQQSFVLGLTAESVVIERAVTAEELPLALMQAGGLMRSPKTLKRYAAILSERFNQEIIYPRERAYEPELATAFARLSLEMWSRQRQAGLDRWSKNKAA